MDFLDEIFEHCFGNFKVGDNAVLQRPYSHDITGCFPEHLLRFFADGDDFFCSSGIFVDSYHRWFVGNNASSLYIYQRVCGAKIYCQIFRYKAEK